MQKIKLCDVKAINPDKGVITFTLTSKITDRDGDIIEPMGADIRNFRKNPVFLWAHDLRRPPIGRVIPESIEISDQEIKADVEFDLNDEFAKMVFEKYKNGFLNAGSIRFIPRKWDEIKLRDADGNETGRITGYHIKEWELLEYSAVPVPANPAALVQKSPDGDPIVEYLTTHNIPITENATFDEMAGAWVKSIADDGEPVNDEPDAVETNAAETNDNDDESITDVLKRLADVVESLQQQIEQLKSQLVEFAGSPPDATRPPDHRDHTDVDGRGGDNDPDGESKSVVPYAATTPAPESREWDKTGALNRLRKWASSDGSGDKDKIDWAKYRRAFAWYDPNDAQNFGAYKLPHHDVMDGKLVVVWRGVAAAMAALMGARGGVQIPDSDRRGVYNHLAKHYKQFDKQPPEFKSLESLEDHDAVVLDEILNDSSVQERIVERVMEMLNEGDGLQ